VNPKITVVIPAFRCKQHILEVLAGMPALVTQIILVDDACPDGTGKFAQENCKDPRLEILFRTANGGVGAAMKTGYLRAIKDYPNVIVKMDGDNQMDPKYLPDLIEPILEERADYTKGNRFYDPRTIRSMPFVRIFGNAGLSFLTKLSTGYYSLFDPNNGYTALSGRTAQLCDFERLHDRFFFESDMLFRLNLVKAVVLDVPMPSKYGSEKSNLNELSVIPMFLFGHSINFYKRVVYNYFLRDFSLGSLYLLSYLVLVPFGIVWSLYFWYQSLQYGKIASTGTVMIGILPIMLGFQFLVSFFSYDISQEPKKWN
jgi:dolichol-phosphate mannosyltransferase